MPGAPGPPSFGCTTLATGSGCQLTLLFAPTTVVAGTLQLAFDYDSNAGAAKTGTVSLQYSSTAHNRLLATVSPACQVTAEVNQGIQVAAITFTSDDGNPVTNVAITAGLASLPTDWTGPASFTCASAATGTSCALPLQFQPTSASSNGTISLNYSYLDNAGSAQTGSVDVPYASVPTYFYVNGESGSVLRCAASFTDGSLSGCVPVASGFISPYGIASNCVITALSANFAQAVGFAFNNGYTYISGYGGLGGVGGVFVCPVTVATGNLDSCVLSSDPAIEFQNLFGIAAH